MVKRHIIILISVLVSTAGMISCADRVVIRELDDVETYISEHPDSALAVLDSISAMNIQGRKANAKFALLYSMALDKNYIDVTDNSLINIAVDWYRRHGTADERLKSYYYQGRVYQNAGDNEAAMESFVKAETEVAYPCDRTAAGLLYLAMSDISMNIFDFEKVLEYSISAGKIFRSIGDTLRYTTSLLTLDAYYAISGDRDKESSVLDTIGTFWNSMDMQNRNSYSQMKLTFFKNTENFDSLSAGLHKYILEFPEDQINWLSVSEFYLALGDAVNALSALQKYEVADSAFRRNPVYHIYSSEIYDSLGNFEKSLEAYKEYSYLTDSIDIEIFNQDTKYQLDKYNNTLRLAQMQNSRTVVILVGVIAVIIAVCAVYILIKIIRRRNADRLAAEAKNRALAEEKTRLETEIARFHENYTHLKQERDELSEMLSSNPPVDRQSMIVLNDRLELLNKFFAAAISGNNEIDRSASRELDRLVSDRDMFLYTTRMTFAAAHPEFIAYLESRGLTEWQIEYCCLYAIGLKGKEIGSYLKRKRHYIDSCEIRAKLGLGEHDTNLGIYLREILSIG